MPTSTARSSQFLLERFSPKQIRSIAAANRRINLWEGAVSSGKTIASAWAWMMFVLQASTTGELVMIGKTKDSLYRNVLQPLMNPETFGELAAQVEYTPGAVTCRIFGRLVHVIDANDIKSENKIRGMTCAGAYVDAAVPVTSVNTKTGAVVLGASDVGALPSSGGTVSGNLNVTGVGRTLFVRKTSDQSVTSSTTLANDSQLLLPVVANATYTLFLMCIFSGGTTGDIKFDWTVPSGTALRCAGVTRPALRA
ncbi:hypothetical protein [Streptomyces sp. NPDC096012]|uniref:hypothetical protein n=1 Tax=Streptomyces sp. NPDC096012 TaxID=3155684 RepID=UPI00336A345F